MHFFSKYESFDCNYSDLEVSLSGSDNGKKAVASLDFYVNGIKSGRSFPIIGSELSPESVIVTLEKSGLGGWKVREVEGLRINEEGFF